MDYYAKLWRKAEYEKDENLSLQQIGKFWLVMLKPDNFLKYAERKNWQATNFDNFNEFLSEYLFEETAVRYSYNSKDDLKNIYQKKE